MTPIKEKDSILLEGLYFKTPLRVFQLQLPHNASKGKGMPTELSFKRGEGHTFTLITMTILLECGVW